MAAAATAAKTLSAMASGRMASCTCSWMTSGRVTGKYRPDIFWCVDAVLLLLQRGRQRGQVTLQGGNPGGAARQAHAHGRVLVRGQQLAGGGGREDAAVGDVGLVDQRGRHVHDRGQPVGPDHRRAGRLASWCRCGRTRR